MTARPQRRHVRNALLVLLGATLFTLPAVASAGAAQDVGPTLAALHVGPKAVPWTGGTVSVTARVTNATACRVRYVPTYSGTKVVVERFWRRCSKGVLRELIVIAPNASLQFRHIVQFELLARGHNHRMLVMPFTVSMDGDVMNQSQNWAGYVLTSGGPFDSVSASFTVPTLTCRPGQQVSGISSWVGVDGAPPGDNQVFQDGVDSMCVSGQQVNTAWWEWYPLSGNDLTMTVNTGDQILATVSSAGTDEWNWEINDETTGAILQSPAPIAYTGPASSAEWILEDPGDGDQSKMIPFPLGCTPVTFSNMTVSPGSWQPSASGLVQIANDTSILATPDLPSNPAGNGSSMTVTCGA